MSASLFHSRYGESGVRVVRVIRRGDRHEIKDLSLDITLEGDFVASHVEGDNRNVLPGVSMKNAVYALAGKHGAGEIEDFALALTHHFLLEHPRLAVAAVAVKEHRWSRIASRGRPHDHAFSRNGEEKRVTHVRRTPDTVQVDAGIEDVVLLKTAGLGFEGYLHDRYTPMHDSGNPIVATTLNTRWRYGWTEIPYGLHWQQVRQVVLDTFAEHDSRSPQHMLFAMAQAALEQCPPITEIRFRVPARHHVVADLSPFGLENDNEVFVAMDEPHAVIEATVRREELR